MNGLSQDDIIRMAREAHLDVYGLGKDRKKFVSVVERFANLVAAAEREACAKVCEELGYYAKHGGWGCADAIRERGQDEMS